MGVATSVGKKSMGFLGKFGRLLSFGGIFSGSGLIFKIVSSIWTYKSLNVIPDALSNHFGKHYDDVIRENPAIMFFANAFVITLVASILILFLYRILGINMGRKMKTLMGMTPFILVICGVVYLGYRQNLRNQDVAYSIFKDADTERKYIVAATKSEYDHRKLAEADPRYIIASLGKALPDVFYKFLIEDVDKSQLAHVVKMRVRLNTYENGLEYEIPVTPLMYAAAINNIAAVRYMLESGKVDVKLVVTTSSEAQCPRNYYWGWFTGKQYARNSRHTAWRIARDNGNREIMKIIEDYCLKNNISPWEYQGSYTENVKEVCPMGS